LTASRNVRALLVYCVLLAATLCQCRDLGRPSGKPGIPPPRDHVTQDPVVDYDSLTDQLLALQNAVHDNPGNTKAIAALLKVSVDTASGCLLLVGKGTTNQTTPDATWEAARRTAAKLDAQRWALYEKAWHTGEMVRYGRKISGDIMYSKTLFERQGDDTLCQLLQIPIGSVVVK
jgi:hypothetical protein